MWRVAYKFLTTYLKPLGFSNITISKKQMQPLKCRIKGSDSFKNQTSKNKFCKCLFSVFFPSVSCLFLHFICFVIKFFDICLKCNFTIYRLLSTTRITIRPKASRCRRWGSRTSTSRASRLSIPIMNININQKIVNHLLYFSFELL